MKFYKNLYVSDNIKNVEKIKLSLKIHRGLINIYLICVAKGNNQLEIINAAFIKLPYYRKHPPVVVGIAQGYSEAVQLVEKMLNDTIEYTGKPYIKDFLFNKVSD